MESSLDNVDANCAVCYEEFNVGSEFDEEIGACIPIHLKGCQHRFCRDCLSQHCSYGISKREYPIPCPASAADCTNTIDDEQVKDLLVASKENINEFHGKVADWKSFSRLQHLSKDPSLTACCRCQEIVSTVDHVKDRTKCLNTLTCQSCSHVFCSIHGDAHPNTSCVNYSKQKPSRLDRKSEKLIQKHTKPCSHCGAPIEKAAGCDHVVCLCCGDDMCYRCGKHDLTGTTIRVCKNCDRSYVDHRHIWTYRLVVCLGLPLFIPFSIAYVAFIGSFAILSFGCCFCQCGGLEIDDDGEKSYSLKRGAARVTLIVFLPVLDFLGSFGADCGLSARLQKHGLGPQIPSSQHTETWTTTGDGDNEDDLDAEDYRSDGSRDEEV